MSFMDIKAAIKVAQIVGPVILIAVIVCGFFYLKNVKEDRDRYKRERNDARAQIVELQNEQLEVYEVADALEKKLNSVSADRDALHRRLRNNATVCVANTATGVDYAATTGEGLFEAVGIAAGTIIDEAAACDENTERLIACQSYIRTILKWD